MDNNGIEILREFETRIARLKKELQELETQVAACLKSFEEAPAKEEVPADLPVDTASEPVDVEIDIDVIDIPGKEVPPAETAVSSEPVPEHEPAAAPEPPEAEPDEAEDLPEDLPGADEPVSFAELTPKPEPAPEIGLPAEPEPEPLPENKALRTVEGNFAWKTDRPGMPVKNIRSAISLFDRALFINTLFKEDYALYDRTIGDLNALTSLDEAVDYLLGHFPDWNLGSDVVYSFIMAVRKKLG